MIPVNAHSNSSSKWYSQTAIWESQHLHKIYQKCWVNACFFLREVSPPEAFPGPTVLLFYQPQITGIGRSAIGQSSVDKLLGLWTLKTNSQQSLFQLYGGCLLEPRMPTGGCAKSHNYLKWSDIKIMNSFIQRVGCFILSTNSTTSTSLFRFYVSPLWVDSLTSGCRDRIERISLPVSWSCRALWLQTSGQQRVPGRVGPSKNKDTCWGTVEWSSIAAKQNQFYECCS